MPRIEGDDMKDVTWESKILEVLAKARETYGNNTQIMVAIEELNELACVLAKFPRYDDEEEAKQELFNKCLDEVADVYTILEHIKAIFEISDEQLLLRRVQKAMRLQSWIEQSNSMQQTVEVREVPDVPDDMQLTMEDCVNTEL